MPKIPATESQTFEVKAPMETVYATFADPEIVKENFVGLERAEMKGNGEVRWILEEKVDKGIRFRGDYTVRYEGNGKDRIRWHTLAGNIDSEAEVALTEIPSGVRVRYRETIAPDLPIPRLMAKIFRPIVAREVRKDLVKYVENVKRYLEHRTG